MLDATCQQPAVECELNDDGGARTRTFQRRAHVRRELGQFFRRPLPAVLRKLSGVRERELEQRLVRAEIPIGRMRGENADECGKRAI